MEVQRDKMIEMEMLRDGDDMKVHYMRMSPHEVQARCVMRTRSATEGVSNLFARMSRRASALNCLQ